MSGNLLGATNYSSSEFYWSLDAAGADISITNVTSSNVVSYDFGTIMALKGGENNSNRQWVISPVRIIVSILIIVFF